MASTKVIKLSEGISFVLIATYILYYWMGLYSQNENQTYGERKKKKWD